uniref:Uncharacterized protein n=1 Tax=Maylandia zebra TaxID=106582 RepID=A0A3P9AWW0_9CICH
MIVPMAEIEAVPDLAGFPPNKAISCCSSRSNSLSKTNSLYFVPTAFVSTFRAK